MAGKEIVKAFMKGFLVSVIIGTIFTLVFMYVYSVYFLKMDFMSIVSLIGIQWLIILILIEGLIGGGQKAFSEFRK